MRKLFLAAAIAAVIVVAALAFSGVGLSRWLDSQTPEIAADLPYEDPAAASRQFNKRFVDKFPVGSEADELTAFLISQRFEVFEFEDLPVDEWRFATSRVHWLCSRFWEVEWKRDKHGAIQDIRAKYSSTCH